MRYGFGKPKHTWHRYLVVHLCRNRDSGCPGPVVGHGKRKHSGLVSTLLDVLVLKSLPNEQQRPGQSLHRCAIRHPFPRFLLAGC